MTTIQGGYYFATTSLPHATTLWWIKKINMSLLCHSLIS